MEKALLVKIEGRVTGVGFRYCAKRQAAEFSGLKGYVRNLGYGEVEVLVQGPENEVEQMVCRLRQGEPPARVDRFSLFPVPVNPALTGFDIR